MCVGTMVVGECDRHFWDGCARVGKPRRCRGSRQRGRQARPLLANSVSHPSVARHRAQDETAEPVRPQAPLLQTDVTPASSVHMNADIEVSMLKFANVVLPEPHEGQWSGTSPNVDIACSIPLKDILLDASPSAADNELGLPLAEGSFEAACHTVADPSSVFEKDMESIVPGGKPRFEAVSKSRRARFDLGACSVHEITPYSEIYGLHPRDFVFDRGYSMIPAYNFMPIDLLAAKHWANMRRTPAKLDEETTDSESDFEDEFNEY